MDCQQVMAPIKESLYADEPASKAIDFMVRKHMGLVPVTDREGKFVGLLSGDRLMHFMLPRTVSAFLGIKRGMKRASYLHESSEEMQERLDVLRERPVGELVEHHAKVCHPDTPLIDALTMIKHKQYVVPVVEHDRTLVGAISFFSVLYALREEYAKKKRTKETEI